MDTNKVDVITLLAPLKKVNVDSGQIPRDLASFYIIFIVKIHFIRGFSRIFFCFIMKIHAAFFCFIVKTPFIRGLRRFFLFIVKIHFIRRFSQIFSVFIVKIHFHAWG